METQKQNPSLPDPETEAMETIDLFNGRIDRTTRCAAMTDGSLPQECEVPEKTAQE